MSCDVTATGTLESCVIQEEAPKAFGFGAATLGMSRSFEMRPGIGGRRGSPHGEVRIPVNFRLRPAAPTAATKSLSPGGKALAERLVASADPVPGFLGYYDNEAAKLEASSPGVSPEASTEAAKALRAAARAKAPVLRQAFGEAIAAKLSETELAQFVTFAESDLGRRWFAADAVPRETLLRLKREQQERIRDKAREILCRTHDCARSAEGLPEPQVGGSPRRTASDPDSPLSRVPWNRQPSITDTLAAWPIGLILGMDGAARSTCTIGLLGAPEDCELTYEYPMGLGVGAAAQRLTERYRVTPAFLSTGVGKKVLINTYFIAGAVLRSTEKKPVAETPSPPAGRLALARRLMALQAQRLGPPLAEMELATLKTMLAPLESGLQREVEAALFAARDDSLPEILEARARVVAENYDDEDLRRIVRFEEALGPAIQRAAKAAEPELKAAGMAATDQVSAAARESFCRTRDCQAPVFTQPPPTAASPEPSTRNP